MLRVAGYGLRVFDVCCTICVSQHWGVPRSENDRVQPVRVMMPFPFRHMRGILAIYIVLLNQTENIGKLHIPLITILQMLL